MVYFWHHAIPASQFWQSTTPETEMFSTTAVAIALGIGRKGMLEIPVEPALIWKKQRYFSKGDVIRWTIEDEKRGEESVLLSLRRKHKKRQPCR